MRKRLDFSNKQLKNQFKKIKKLIENEVRQMSRRFEEVFDILDYNELMRFKTDVDAGAITVKRLLEEKIKNKLKEHEKVCATCSNTLNFYKTSNYTIVFGPDDFKKKASFCGLDCLEYFILKLKDLKTPKEDNVSKTGSYF